MSICQRMKISALCHKLALVDTWSVCGSSVFHQGDTGASITLVSFEVRPTPGSLLTNVATINLVTSLLSNNVSSDRRNEIRLLGCFGKQFIRKRCLQLRTDRTFNLRLKKNDVSEWTVLKERCEAAIKPGVKNSSKYGAFINSLWRTQEWRFWAK